MHFQEFALPTLPMGQKQTGWLTVATRADGSEWRLPLLTITGQHPGPTLVVTAAVHGDEYEGIEAIPTIFRQVEPTDLRGKLVMVPVCNMPAYEAATRSSPIDGLNLARVFPGDPNGTITQQIAYWIAEKLLRHADFYIDLHSGGATYQIPTLIGYVYDAGSIGQRSQAGARAFGAPVLWGHPLPTAPGRTVSAATDFGVPWLYTEAPGGGYARPDDVACFVQGVINVMRWLAMLAGTPEPRPLTHHLFGDGNLDQVIDAAVAGYFRAEVNLLDPVVAGQRLGRIVDLFGQVLQEVTADQAGVVIMLRRFHRVHVGDGLAQITTVLRDA
ncbi:MAG: succinylglutamate desuccinylase/aspartoacylase family protein [Caldilineaceae bacterium]|nr:succinylglutamate desuccinylase/aspartoacylase family protein [Caldilineaceae bacterium]